MECASAVGTRELDPQKPEPSNRPAVAPPLPQTRQLYQQQVYQQELQQQQLQQHAVANPDTEDLPYHQVRSRETRGSKKIYVIRFFNTGLYTQENISTSRVSC